ncbi:hypothetical protein Pint_23653 [Pistacia integerrima]|uniref:Uncharacterized protein n=1 Tax=Pistacia integerrima TaxID=434235 RepID=A0ACC0YHM6_9ROSI|nr:hypothetical protein Pint_23653 [Pistacia integerrima]
MTGVLKGEANPVDSVSFPSLILLLIQCCIGSCGIIPNLNLNCFKPMFEISILSSESVLTLALVVLVEPLEGQILMDGLDISNIGLQDFRSKVRYNSSRNQVVSRIIRTNLDPVEQPSDQEDER